MNEIKQRESQLEEFKNEQDKRVNQIKYQLKQKATQVEKLMDQIAQHDKTVEILTKDATTQQNELIKAVDQINLDIAQRDDLIETMERLREENQVLLMEVQNREQEVTALEDEIYKLLSHFEEKNKSAKDENIKSLKHTIQERNQSILILKQELKNIKKSYGEDIEALDEHIMKTQQQLKGKDDANKELMAKLDGALEKADQVKTNYQERLKQQFEEFTVIVKERDVEIATLQRDCEAQEETMLKKKTHMQEEMKEVKYQLYLVAQELKVKDEQILDLRDSLNKRKAEEQKKHSNDKWKDKALYLENKHRDQMIAYRALKHKWVSANDQNEILNRLLDRTRKDTESSKTEEMLQRLNYELRKDLDDKSRSIDQLKSKIQEIERANKELTKQLQRHQDMLSRSFSTFDSLKERKDHVESILYEQTNQSFLDRNEKLMSIN
ncbi:hypothetical protein G6F56_009054 [Rhizopus delemar]|uniref:Uncharacterized protein n=1 Tax=Rhizopus stolonifer TaxID=4846 RepID=A0A367IXE7_RHIST|nr:hypothetical protein G6F56_009054 [Rhizopus delemar]RCH82380.1 hypothetical protein CU098_005813 [Rhizopus stolonifer]